MKGRWLARDFHLEPVDRALDTLEYMLDKSKGLDGQIHDAFLKSPEAQLLRTIPGVGELAAVTLVAFLCPITRFTNVDKISSYAGLVPTTHQSGDSCYHGKLM